MERRFIGEIQPMSMQADENVLRHILGVCPVPQNAVSDPQDLSFRLAHGPVERSRLSGFVGLPRD